MIDEQSKPSASRRALLKSSIAMMSSGFAAIYAPVIWPSMKKSSTDNQRAIRTIENLWIPLSDGTRIAARMWLPVDAETSPVPAVLEYLPYRKRDRTRGHDEYYHGITAHQGYACLRVEIRGSGESTGLLDDEYLQQEQDDMLEIMRWIAEQPWCNGSIGMRGLSWSGINALQVAAQRPPELKAIITHGSTDDRFLLDAHYLGGSLSHFNISYGQAFMIVASLPPDPAIVGNKWKEEWLERLENLTPIIHRWTQHQKKDVYWKYGSVSENYKKIQCPVYAVNGFIDLYRDTVPRLLQHLNVPRKGFIGPGGHQCPDWSDPGPAVNFLHEEVRWWDHWLKGINTGVMEEPMLVAFMRDKAPAKVYPDTVPGRWVAEKQWPSSRIKDEIYYLNTSGLSRQAGQIETLTVEPNLSVGITHLGWTSAGSTESLLPGEQNEDDNNSLVLDSDVLKEDFEILGQPVVKLVISANKPVARVAIRLNEVDENGTSWLVTQGFLNLTHRGGHETPQALKPGTFYAVDVPLYMIAHRFRAGFRIRVSISESYWPMIWPSPELVKLTLRTAESQLILPIRPRGGEELEGFEFSEPAPRDETFLKVIEPGTQRLQRSGQDETIKVLSQSYYGDTGIIEISNTGTRMRGIDEYSVKINPSDPGSASWEACNTFSFMRGDWRIKVRVEFQMTSDKKYFYLKSSYIAYDNDDIVFENKWTDTIARYLN